MKTSKKYLAGLLLCTTVLALTGCGEKDPYTVYDKAMKKNAELKSCEITSDMNISMNLMDMDLAMNIATNARVSGQNTDKLTASIVTQNQVQDETISVQAYYQDGYYYTESGESKIKYPMDAGEFQDSLSSSSFMVELQQTDFETISMVKNGKEYKIDYTIKGDTLRSMVDSAMSSLTGLLSSGDMEMEISDITGSASINKAGYIYDETMQMTISFQVEEQPITTTMDIHSSYVNPGQDVAVEIPADLGEYVEATP